MTVRGSDGSGDEVLEALEGADLDDAAGGLGLEHLLFAGEGSFNVPGMMKVVVQNKKAVKARKGINPFTGDEQM